MVCLRATHKPPCLVTNNQNLFKCQYLYCSQIFPVSNHYGDTLQLKSTIAVWPGFTSESERIHLALRIHNSICLQNSDVQSEKMGPINTGWSTSDLHKTETQGQLQPKKREESTLSVDLPPYVHLESAMTENRERPFSYTSSSFLYFKI